jgi:hypothetical protein
MGKAKTNNANPTRGWGKPEVGDKVRLRKSMNGISARTILTIEAVTMPFDEDNGKVDLDAFQSDGWWIRTDIGKGAWWAQVLFRPVGRIPLAKDLPDV